MLGVFDDQWLQPLANVLKQLGSVHAMVVHAADGLDEISISGETNVCELREGEVTQYRISPQQFGLTGGELEAIQVSDAAASANMIQALLKGEAGPATDIVALNAGAAIYVAGISDTLQQGIETAIAQLKSGAAADKLAQLVKATNQN